MPSLSKPGRRDGRISAREVEQYLAQDDGRVEAPSRRPLVRGPIAVRDYSLLFYAESAAFPAPALVKICLDAHTREPDSGSAQRQYNALIAVHQAMKLAPGFSVPQPYLIRPDLALLAIEWIDGINVARKAFSWRMSAANAEANVVRCASWLRAFHASGRRAAGRLDVEARLPVVEEMAKRGLADAAFQAGLKQLRRSADAAAASSLPRAWIHGDFTADNVIVCGSRTIGIDLQLQHENAVVYDLAPFLNNVTLSLLEPRAWLLMRSHLRLRKAFLAAYCQGEKADMETPIAWVQLYMALQQWQSARTRAHQGLRRRFLDFQYRWLTADLVRRMGR